MTATAAAAEYGPAQMVTLTGITPGALVYWTRQERLTVNDHGRYDATELDVARLAVALIDRGFLDIAAFDLARRVITEDRVTIPVADIFELTITVRDTTAAP